MPPRVAIARLDRHRESARRAILIYALLGFGFIHHLSAAPATPVDEYMVKAVYLARFMEYVDWPVVAGQPPNPVLTIGVLAPDPFAGQLEEVASTATPAAGRRLRIKHARQIEDLADCDAIFVCKDCLPPADAVKWLGNRPILLVSDQPGAIAAGFHLEFRLVKNTVRFAANPSAAKKLGLTLRARLLSSALEIAATPAATPVPRDRPPPKS